MGTVSQYKMSNFQSALGGSNPIRMSEYYRGVTYVPTTGPNEFARQPATGEYYVKTDPRDDTNYYWLVGGIFNNAIIWGTTQVGDLFNDVIPDGATTYTIADSTYYRGTFRQSSGNIFPDLYYAVYRYQVLYGPINTSVPTSGAISFSNFNAAENYSPGFMGGVYLGNQPGVLAFYTGSNETIIATATFYPNGTYAYLSNDGATYPYSGPFYGNWGSPTSVSSAGSNYWIKFTRLSFFASDPTVAAAQSTPTTGWLNLSTAQGITVTTYNNADPTYEIIWVTYQAQIALDSAGTQIINESYFFTVGASWDPPF